MSSTPRPQKARFPVVKRSILHLSLIMLLLGLSGSSYALDYGPVTATLDRSDPHYVTIDLQFINVNTTDQQTLGVTANDIGQVQQAVSNHLDICMAINDTQSGCGETDYKVRYSLARQPTPQDGAYDSQYQTADFPNGGTLATQNTLDPTIYTYQIAIRIHTAGDPLLEHFSVGEKVFLRLYPDKTASNLNKDKSDVVVVLGSGVKDAVPLTGVFPTKGTLIATFNNPASVTFNNGTTGTPNGVAALLIPDPADAASAVFTATQYLDNPPAGFTPADVACRVESQGLDTDNPTCTAVCEPPDGSQATLDLNASYPSGFQLQQTASLSDQAIAFTGLSIGTQYAIVAEFLPEGTGFSCAIGTPSDATTLVQLDGGPDPKPGDASCFIATAAYGSALDPHIDVLRWFRDAYLLKTHLGKSFVRTYYRLSPPVADWIREHEWARTLTRGALWAPVLTLQMVRDHGTMSMLGALALISGLVYLGARRRLA